MLTSPIACARVLLLQFFAALIFSIGLSAQAQAAPVINPRPGTLPNAVISDPYATNFFSTGSPYPVRFTAYGALPPGLSLDQNTGRLAGTPTQEGTWTVYIDMVETNGGTGGDGGNYTITVLPRPPVVHSLWLNSTYNTGNAAPMTIDLTPQVIVGPHTGFELQSATTWGGGGVTIDGAGHVTYTPPVGFRGEDRILWRATSLSGPSDWAAVWIDYTEPVVTFTPASLPNGSVGAPYGQTIEASGGMAPYDYALASGSLPPGMTLQQDGTLTGVPTATGTFNFAFTARDHSTGDGRYSAPGNYQLVIDPAAAPVIASLSPTVGPTTGGNTVVITGSSFLDASAVTFGGTAATGFTVDSPTQITATAPAGAAGILTVSVSTPAGTSPPSAESLYAYAVFPAVSGISPDSGSTSGGASITIAGTSFTPSTTVTIGGVSAIAVTFVNAQTLTAIVPAYVSGALTKDVTVQNETGSGTLPNAFTYIANPPTLISATPNNGPTTGGTEITLSGSDFTPSTTVTVGGIAASSVTATNSTTLTAIVPAYVSGALTKDIVVNNGVGSATLSGAYTYTPVAPTAVSLSPSTGAMNGGTAVTLTGTGFTPGSTLTIGGIAATNVTVTNSTTITATAPTYVSGPLAVDVTIDNGAGTATLSSAFTYVVLAPTISGITPDNSPTAGGIAVTVTGMNFTPETTLSIGGVAATNISVINRATLNATVPAYPGGALIKNVTVTNETGSANLIAAFTYNPSPATVSGISPNSGPQAGGTSVTITGSNFTPAIVVTIGGISATGINVVNSSTLTAIVPAYVSGPLAKDVVVNNGAGSGTLTGGFTYDPGAPTLTAISPTYGSVQGGTTVTLTGSGFSAGNTVTFDGIAAAGVTVVNDTTITALTPAHNIGAVDVAVTNAAGAATLTNAYTFTLAGPTVTSISPTNGPAGGGNTVSITGQNFTGVTAVTFGGVPGTDLVISDAMNLSVRAPAHSSGLVDVIVSDGVSNGTLFGAYTYNAGPPSLSINDVSQNEGGNGYTGFAFTVSLSAPAPAGGVTFDIATADGTANSAVDYVLQNLTSQTIPAGQSTYTFTVNVIGDLTYEADETFFVNVTNVTGATITDGQGLGTIENDDAQPSVAIFDVRQNEGTGGSTIYNFTVRLGPASGLPVTVNYATADGTATAPSDYLATSGTITFAPGQLEQTISVTVVGDSNLEPNEEFYVDLSSPVNAMISGPRGVGMIDNDDTGVTITTLSLQDGQVGAAYHQTVATTGGTAPVTFALTSGSLPAGITLDTATGVVSGTATEAGTFGFEITATDSTTPTPTTDTQVYGVTFNPPTIVVDPATLPNARAGTAYNQTVTAAGGTAPYAFAVTAGALPPGLTLSSGGALSGTPTASDTYNFTITATDSSTSSGPYASSRSYTISVLPPNFTLTPPALSGLSVGTPYSGNFVAGGGTAPYTYTRIAGALPPGLTFASDGSLTGTPTASGTFNFTVIARDSTGGSGAPFAVGGNFNMVVGPPTITLSPASGALPGVMGGTSYSQTFTASGGVAPHSFAVTAGALPAGLTLSADGTISGAPTASGTFNFTVTATDSSTGGGPYTDSAAYSITVTAPVITVTPATLPNGQQGFAYATQTFSATGGAGPYTYSLDVGTLPLGLSLTSSGTLSGTPTASGTFSFRIAATDNFGFSGTQQYDVTINQALPTVASISPASGPTAGGTAVTITGANFLSVSSVTIGGAAVSNLTVVNPTTITATTPAHPQGAADVVVTTPGGAGTLAGGFSYIAPGAVRLVMNSGDDDGSFVFSSLTTGLNFTITTSGGAGQSADIALAPGNYTLSFTTPAGFGLAAASCSPSTSTVNVSAKTASLVVASNVTTVCTIQALGSRRATTEIIGAALDASSRLVIANAPSLSRRLDRLNGRSGGTGGGTASAFGKTFASDLPFSASFGANQISFAMSLSGLRAKADEDHRFVHPNGVPAALAASSEPVSGTAVTAVADMATASLASRRSYRFDAWVEGAIAQFDGAASSDGDFAILHAGADYLISDHVLLGVGIQGDWLNMDTASGSFESTGWLAGPYLTARLNQNLYIDARAAWGGATFDVSPFGTYTDTVDSERALYSAALIGQFDMGNLTIRPEARVTWYREVTDAYIDSLSVAIPEVEIKTGEMTFGPTFEWTIRQDSGATLVPSLGFDLVWTFQQDNTATAFTGAPGLNHTGMRGRIEAGLGYQSENGVTLGGSLFYDGIGGGDYAAWGIKANIRMGF